MKFEEIKLESGFVLYLQTDTLEDQEKRINCRYIGALPGKYLLATHPANTRLRTGQKLVVKAMIANGIAVFPVTVESVMKSPVSIVYFTYPPKISVKQIRSATRVNVNLAVNVKNNSQLTDAAVEGRLADLSTSGAKIELKDVVGEVGDELVLEASIQLGDIHRQMSLKSVIRARIDRSTKEQDEAFPAVYGLEFLNNDEDNRLLLQAYVYRQLAGV
ncbi:flagellar brake protein [Pseudomaricurvus sp.]|uniref:flagellar brake protein n=1 Tax=Pseudomaricurvus sp. TaxID=2004510 RepID=UPI003F6B0F60